MNKILVVDDDADLLEVMVTLLESKGYAVKAITNGEETYQAVDTFHPDLIILDIWLSGKDGRDICKRLKTQEGSRNIPVIMFSAHPKAIESLSEIGADDFIAKPFDIKQLMSKVTKYFSENP